MLQIQFVKNNNPDYISNGFHQKFFTRTVRWWLMVLIFVPEHCHLKRHCARPTWSWIIYYHLIWAPASIQLSMGNYFNCPVKYPKDFSRCTEKTTISNKCIFKPSMSHMYWQHAHRDHFNVIAGERWWVWGQWVASMSRCAIIARLGGAALVMVTLMNSNQSFCATMCERWPTIL